MSRVAWILLTALLLTAAPSVAQELPVRVGLLSYQDDQEPLVRLRLRAAELRGATPSLEASFAIGTYGELWHWIAQEQIEVALINPGLFARLPSDSWEYLGSAQAVHPDELQSVWLARKDSGLVAAADLEKAGSELKVIAVHPLSVSGFINPLAALNLAVPSEQLRFSHSHTNSLRYLANSEGPWVAAVWKPTWLANPDPDLVEVEVPGLEDLENPAMVLVGRKGNPGAQAVKELVRKGGVSGYSFDPKYADQIAALPPVPSQVEFERPLDQVDLDDLMLTLHHYNQTHPEPARLGLVLTGGGAKCSYQAGAVRALEESLAQARQRLQDPELDIDLVVGTSGGAINAISVALGLTGTEEGFADVRSAWLDLDQKEIVCPPPAVRWNLWLWFASIAGLLALALIGLLRLSTNGGVALTAALGALLTGLPQIGLKSGDSTAQHFWAWVSWGVEGAGLIMLAAALSGGLLAWKRRRQGRSFAPGSWALRVCVLGVAVLPLLQTWTMFFHEEYVSENRGLESALIRNFGRLIDNEMGRRGQQAAQEGGADLAALSMRVFEAGLLRRDLVLTASPLTDPELDLPGEYYFFAAAEGPPGPEPDFGKLGVSLSQKPQFLFDAMLGSAAIYPLFPARRLQGLPEAGQHVDLVDGSFAHRNPVEGAVKWGATHILVIEASTTEVVARGALLNNFGAALTFLYDQAQLVDVRLKGRTSLYTLYPSAPHIGLLDFATPLIEGSLDKGYREARGSLARADEGGGNWHKVLGPPHFWTPEAK